ncbi:recombinase family protein [Pantanalinema rosaneae CENA516]|uniref:recombinase family protein n=1 Tax=Pantanalinema rosaneae TaxID=1620701 RepID=UPI003D6E690B
MESHSKIHPEHLDRIAIVYLRQSTPQQVKNNRESTALQYSLAKLAERYGWQPSKVLVLDEDLGKSGRFSYNLEAFQKMQHMIAQGQAGAIFVTEASRATRSQASWLFILEIAAYTNTLVIDTEAVYDPRDINDQLVLGMKGTFSQIEHHQITQRTLQARQSMAARGELRHYVATGYKYNALGKLEFDPDVKVQEMILFIHKKFRELGSSWKVLKFFNEQKILVPVKKTSSEHIIEWKPMTASYLSGMLKNPIYAGTYVHGRTKVDVVFELGKPRKTRKRLPRKEWKHIFLDAHPAYISWEEFLQNEQLLAQNTTKFTPNGHSGPAREGAALLQGIVLCGSCGRRMFTRYKEGKKKNLTSYICSLRQITEGCQYCARIPADAIDQAITNHVLELVNEEELDFSLAILDKFEQEFNQEERLWQIKLQKAEEAVEQAEWYYKMANREHTHVCSILSQEWDDAAQQLKDLEQSYEQAKSKEKLKLSAEQKQHILRLAQDLPSYWNSPTTTIQERKELLRLLIKQVLLESIQEPERKTHIKVLWHTGAVTEFTIARTKKPRLDKTPDFLIEQIRFLSSERTDAEIANELNQQGFVTGVRKPFTKTAVYFIRQKYNIPKGNVRKTSPQIIEEVRSLVIVGKSDAEIANELNQRGFVTGAKNPFTEAAVFRIRHQNNLPKYSHRTPDFLIEQIRSLIDEKTNAEIAHELNQRGFVTGTRKPFTAEAVRLIRQRYNLPKGNARKPSLQTIDEIRSLAIAGKSDVEIAHELNRRGFVTGTRKPFTARIVSEARRTYNICRVNPRKTSDSIIEEIRSLVNEKTDAEIADQLNQRGFVSGARKPFTEKTVYQLRQTYNLPKSSSQFSDAVIEEIRALMNEKTDTEIANELNQRGFLNQRNKPFTKSAINKIRHHHNLIRENSSQISPHVVEKIRFLIKDKTDAEIADELNQGGFANGAKKRFTEGGVRWIRHVYDLPKYSGQSLTSLSKQIQELMNEKTDAEIADQLNQQGFVNRAKNPFTKDNIRRIRLKYNLLRDHECNSNHVVEEIRSLMDGKTDAEIAAELNQQGFVNRRNKPFNAASVATVRYRHNLLKARLRTG